jgi:hypothetical protein
MNRSEAGTRHLDLHDSGSKAVKLEKRKIGAWCILQV